jgi:arginase
MDPKIELVINRSEITAGTRGAALGPEAIKVAARAAGNDFFIRFDSTDIPDENHLIDQSTDFRYAKRIDGLLRIYERLTETVSSILKHGNIPLVIAADHGSAGGTVAGIRKAYPEAKLGIVWIDAHADIHSPYTTPSGNLHGMPVATILNSDNKRAGDNALDDSSVEAWETLKSFGVKGPKMLPEHLVYVAVRDTEPEEDSIMEELSIRNFRVDEVRSLGVENTMQCIFDRLSDCDLIYVSFDVDSMDPDLTSYGTGTPVKGGLTEEEAAGILEGLALDERTRCMEFVEVNPCLDEKKNKMAEVTFGLIKRTVSALQNRG